MELGGKERSLAGRGRAQVSEPLRIFSFGGGVQSVAVMVLQATGRLTPYDHFVFANVGEDSENPATLDYLRAVVQPFVTKHGISLVEVTKHIFGEPVSLYDYLHTRKKTIPIPIWIEGSGPGTRTCTEEWKIDVVDRWIKKQVPEKAIVGLGISTNEYQRARDTDWHDDYRGTPFGFSKKREYPLLDLRLSRMDCINVIAEAGLPTPPRSACWFCPFTSRGVWIERKRTEPELFEKAIALEDMFQIRRQELNRDPVYLHKSLKPLRDAVPDQLPLFPDEDGSECDSGYCFV